jgi:PAS domain-containing protein
MKDKDKTKKHLINELNELRRRVALLESLQTKHKGVEEALRESEEKYRLLVENSDIAILVAQDEVIKFPNPKAIELIGYSAEESAKTAFANLIHPDDSETILERYKRRLKGDTPPSTYSFRIIKKMIQNYGCNSTPF